MIPGPTIVLSPRRAVIGCLLAIVFAGTCLPVCAEPVPHSSATLWPISAQHTDVARELPSPTVIFRKKSDKGDGGGSSESGKGKDDKDKKDKDKDKEDKDKKDKDKDKEDKEDKEDDRDDGGAHDHETEENGHDHDNEQHDHENNEGHDHDDSDDGAGENNDADSEDDGRDDQSEGSGGSDAGGDSQTGGGDNGPGEVVDNPPGEDSGETSSTSDETAEEPTDESSGPTEATPHLMLSGTPPESVTAGHLYLFTPGLEASAGSAPVFMIDGLPRWAGFDDISGELYGTPDEADVGIYDAITISATDGVIETSLPTFSIEVVAPGAAQGAVTLSWTPPTENEDGSYLVDLAGYWIYWGNNPGAYTEWMRIDGPGLTTVVIESLVPGTWEFAMTSFNADGVESRLSNAVARVLE